MGIPLEICIDSLESAIAAVPILRRGDRFEVCSSLLAGGGLTPSLGLIHAIREHVPDIALMAMVRPRPGSFVYTRPEVAVMLADISAFKAAGVDGIVFGCLTDEGEVDTDLARRLAAAAAPLQVTFHRAFDVTPSWERACDALASIPGITRILTSGHAATALDGADEVDALTRHVARVSHRPHGTSNTNNGDQPVRSLTILPASGINADSLAALHRRAPLLSEAHLSASAAVAPPPSAALARGEVLGFGSREWRLDVDKLRRVRELVDGWE